MDGKIEICDKETLLLEVVGKEGIALIYKELIRNNNSCRCCGYFPNQNQRLKMHVSFYDKNNPSQSICALLCEACFYLKHFDKSVDLNYPVLVNSDYSQVDLIKIQRCSTIAINNEIDKKTIFILKQKPSEYLKMIKEDPFMVSPYIKVVYSDNFKWNNCRRFDI